MVTAGCGSVREQLVARVRTRQGEVVEAILARIRDDEDGQAGAQDAEYVAGLRTAVAVAVEHSLHHVELGELVGPGLESVPAEALAQARRAARTGVKLDTVLRRYVLGSTVVGDFLMREAERDDFAGHGQMLREALGAQAAVLDRLMSAVTGEYLRELERAERSPEQRRVVYVQRLLAGGLGDGAELGYELDGWHVGAIATGPGAAAALPRVAVGLGCRLLCLARGEDTVWGWFGAQRRIALGDVERACAGERELDASFAVGEPGRGVEGWRLTHRQAQAALRVALHRERRFTRYADVALLAAVLGEDALAGSLVEIYLVPLGSEHDGGAVLRQTLGAYFAAERNASSAASALGVTRRTVENRLRSIEEKLGWTLHTRQAELEIALRLDELDADTRAGSIANGS
jgi:hypothetical protein